MNTNEIRPSTPARQNDQLIFSLLHSDDSEKRLADCVINQESREAFKEFESHHPHLVKASPLLNKASHLSKDLDFTDSAETDPVAFSLRGMHYLASKVYDYTFGYFAKSTMELERILLNDPSRLPEHLSAYPMSSADIDLINAYIESGLLNLKMEGACLFEIPGAIAKLLSRKSSSEPWINQLVENDRATLGKVLSFETLAKTSDVKDLFAQIERIFKINEEAALSLLSQKDGVDTLQLTKPEFSSFVTSWLHSLAIWNPKMMLAVLGIKDDEGKTLLMDPSHFRVFCNSFKDHAANHEDDLLDLLRKQNANGETIFSHVFKDEYGINTVALERLVPLMEKLAHVKPKKTIEALEKHSIDGHTILTKVWSTRLSEMSGLAMCLPILKILAKENPHELAKFLSKRENDKTAFNVSYLYSALLNTYANGMNLLMPVIKIMYETDPTSVVALIQHIITNTPAKYLESNIRPFIPLIEQISEDHPEIAPDILLLAEPSGNLAAIYSGDWLTLLTTFLQDPENEEYISDIRQRFLQVDKNKNTFFHLHMNPSNTNAYQIIADTLNIDLTTLRNRFDLSPLNQRGMSPRSRP